MSISLMLTPVGTLRSPYREKFAIPRQPGLARLPAVLELQSPFDRPEAVRGLDGFSHVWLIFGFHATAAAGWKPTVRPPRLGGNARLGMFATRSTFRPSPLKLSVVELAGIRCKGGVCLDLIGADLLDGTPVYDVKPYLPYADAIPGARAGFAPEPPARLAVTFAPAAAQVLAAHPESRRGHPPMSTPHAIRIHEHGGPEVRCWESFDPGAPEPSERRCSRRCR